MIERKTVLIVMNSLVVGGSERKAIRVANELASRGHRVLIAYLNGPETLRSEIDETVQVQGLARVGRYSIGAVFRLAKIIRRERVDVAFCLNPHPLIYLFPACWLSVRAVVRVVALVNRTELLSTGVRRVRVVYRRLLNRSDAVVFGSKLQLNLWLDEFGLEPSRCLHLYNGVDIRRFERSNVARTSLRDEFDIGPRTIVVTCVAQLRPEKRHEDLISAFGLAFISNPELKLIIVGDGPCRRELEEFAARGESVRSIVFAGEVSDPRGLLSLTDIFVLASTSETFSNAALEAMAMGCCPLLSDVGGAREMVKPGTNGMLYPMGDVRGLAQKLVELGADEALRVRLAEAARKVVVEHFSDTAMFDRYEDLLLSSEKDR